MDFIIILLLTGAVMSLFSIVVMAIYVTLEDSEKKKALRRYARREIMKQMDREKQMNTQLEVTVDMLKEYR